MTETAAHSRLPGWLIWIGLGVPLGLNVLAASPLGPNFVYVISGIPLLLLVWAIAGLGSLIISLQSAIHREWRRCVLASILPIAVLAAALDPFRFVRACNYLGDVAHFIIMKPYYDHKVARLAADQRPRVAVFHWGGMIWASHGLVFDQTDQVALPPGHQSAEWLKQASHNELSSEGYEIRPLWDHYYLAFFPC